MVRRQCEVCPHVVVAATERGAAEHLLAHAEFEVVMMMRKVVFDDAPVPTKEAKA